MYWYKKHRLICWKQGFLLYFCGLKIMVSRPAVSRLASQNENLNLKSINLINESIKTESL